VLIAPHINRSHSFQSTSARKTPSPSTNAPHPMESSFTELFSDTASGRMEREPLHLWHRLLHISLLLEDLLADRVAGCRVAGSRHGWASGRWRGSGCDDIAGLLGGLQDHRGLEHGGMRLSCIRRRRAGKTHMAELGS